MAFCLQMDKTDHCVEHFTISNLDSYYMVDRGNCLTKSLILAPCHTSINGGMKNEKKQFVTVDPEEDLNNQEKEEVLVEQKTDWTQSELQFNNELIKFAPCVIDANRQYEKNNTGGEIDNGLLINPNLQGSLNLESSIFRDDKLHNNQKVKKFFDPYSTTKISSGTDRNNYNSMNVYNESILQQMELIGYSREYVVNCLRNNELNYCTACYYLLMKTVEKAEEISY